MLGSEGIGGADVSDYMAPKCSRCKASRNLHLAFDDRETPWIWVCETCIWESSELDADARLAKRTAARKLASLRRGMSPRLRYLILQRDSFRCRACGSSADEATLHVDHIIPVSAGGKSTADNLQTLCQPCNAGKAASL